MVPEAVPPVPVHRLQVLFRDVAVWNTHWQEEVVLCLGEHPMPVPVVTHLLQPAA